MTETPKKPEIDLQDDDFSSILICAVRYALGRRSYMPGIVVDFIRPLLPYLPDKTLFVLKNDLLGCTDFGDPEIDKPRWKSLMYDVLDELGGRMDEAAKREKEKK